jgi:cytochrome c oxidase cbb3-type subunit 3
LPLWWVVLFVLTVLFSFVYVYAFPGLGATPGSLGWTSRGELEADQAKVAASMAKVYAEYAQQPAEALSRDERAMAIGQRLFINNCATCHGSDARGSKGFPNLTDDDWLHGGTPEKIEETITLGRTGVMPPMAAAVGSASDVRDVANYVLSLSGDPHNPIAAAAGRKKFAACAACHGADGKGNQAIGAPNLADKIWLHGWGEAAIVAMIDHGKTNVMPAQGGRLTPAQIHLLASYVWSLSQSRHTASR